MITFGGKRRRAKSQGSKAEKTRPLSGPTADCSRQIVLRVWSRRPAECDAIQWQWLGKCEADATPSGHLGTAARGWDDDERREEAAAVTDETRTRLMLRGSRDLKWPKGTQVPDGQWGCSSLEKTKTNNISTVGRNYFGLLYSVPCRWLLSHRGSVAQVAAERGGVVLHPAFCFPCDNRPHGHVPVWGFLFPVTVCSGANACIALCLKPHATPPRPKRQTNKRTNKQEMHHARVCSIC